MLLKRLWAFLLLLLVVSSSIAVRAAPVSNSQLSSPAELVDAVNVLRASYGLPPYTPNSILMNIAQRQADYNLSIGTITHISADGLRPFERALQAGYPVAGDLSLGGFFSENITAGVGMTAPEAVQNWTTDDPHLNTMISSNLQDIGAGIAVSGNTYYYVIDCGLSSGETPATFVPPPTYKTPASTRVWNTPNADGSITYIVRPGDTPLGIAINYGISLDAILSLNGLTTKSLIYPDQKLLVHPANTPTSTPPTSTPSPFPTITSWPTSTPTSSPTTIAGTPTSQPGLPSLRARSDAYLVILAAMVLAAIIAVLGIRRKK